MNARFRAGLAGAWLSVSMMKPIRTLGAAVVALAAPALFALPAAADGPRGTIAKIETPLLGAQVTLSTGSRYDHRDDFRGPRYNGRNEWGQTERQVNQLTRDAVQACRAAIRTEGRRAGFHEVDIDNDHWARQLGPNGFHVTFNEVEFENRRRDIETRVSCEVRQGRLASVSGIPQNRDFRRGPPPGRRW
ncbi:hypothetical protein HNE_1006 [Hyphomonas neptunium ATCC 15444]|uniref:Uncharacterized protein n=3 Tax=Hyphomonadaceae TaxID=69657 RepID=Q0C3G4_HYPNA|nr:hypothetical protein HNE_1006 [Hyphomonas neptunium ATCC 15444]KCZ96062.1 hypothetical protein HHI_00245 [Hyphomonas hirschiana VP5]